MIRDTHILMLEDAVTDAELIERELRRANIVFTSKRVDTKDAFLRALAEFEPNIVLSDYSLPQLNGLEALRLLRQNQLTLPFILVTGSLSEEVAVECMKEGADDYILKASLKRLPSAVLKALEKQEAAAEKMRIENALRRSEERFRLVARATNDAIRDWNIVANTVWWSESVRTLFGYAKGEVQVEPAWWKERIHPEDQERVSSSVCAFLEGDEKFWSDEYRYRRADDSYAVVIDRAFILRDEQGKPVRMIGSMMDITERKKAEERINYLAFYDAVTGLPNRTLFEDRLPQALHLANRNKQMVAVMLLELDCFKAINDTLGHVAGDWLLRDVAQRLASCVRGSDTVARFSADGFSLLLTQITGREAVVRIADRTEKNALEIAQSILEVLKSPFTLDGRELYVTASMGIGLYPNDGTEPQTLLKNAGVALHSVKAHGGNGYQFYTETMNATAVENLAFESGLRRALEREEFVLHYQPQVEICTGRIVAVEALIRWQSPHSGFIGPSDFIPLTENNGLIVPIGEWVLRTASKQIMSWQADGLPALRVSVNISPRQFEQPNLVERVGQILDETGLDPANLELELTESSIMRNAERAIVTLHRLRAMNIQIAIDDFGAGYSSLSYLKRFPINRLKIDRSFVSDATSDPTDAAIIMAIITLSQNLRLKVLAEGVETEEQLRFLRLLRCDEFQGYLFSKPLPADEVKQLILNRMVGSQYGKKERSVTARAKPSGPLRRL